MNLKDLIWISVLFVIPFSARGQINTYAISGTVSFQNQGDIYVYLVTEEDFKTPFTGSQVLRLEIEPQESVVEEVVFRFEKVVAGIYGIRCFQDVNGNGKLDRGLRGPSEPWGMSWQEEKPKKWPRYSHIAFEVEQDMTNLFIELQQ